MLTDARISHKNSFLNLESMHFLQYAITNRTTSMVDTGLDGTLQGVSLGELMCDHLI